MVHSKKTKNYELRTNNSYKILSEERFFIGKNMLCVTEKQLYLDLCHMDIAFLKNVDPNEADHNIRLRVVAEFRRLIYNSQLKLHKILAVTRDTGSKIHFPEGKIIPNQNEYSIWTILSFIRYLVMIRE
jgi:hypothetical protein